MLETVVEFVLSYCGVSVAYNKRRHSCSL